MGNRESEKSSPYRVRYGLLNYVFHPVLFPFPITISRIPE